MTDDTNTRDMGEALDETAARVRQALEALVGPASPSAVFSEPLAQGDDLVITAASWERGGGFGFGGGRGSDPQGGGQGEGSGGGGGGGSQGRPVAVIRVGPGGIEVRPVIDFTKIGVTFLLSAVGVLAALRPRR